MPRWVSSRHAAATRWLVSAAVVFAPLAASQPARADVAAPADDPFYAQPADIGTFAPGTVIRSREVDVSLEGVPLSGIVSHAYQLQYRSNDAHDNPVANVTTVVVPNAPSMGNRAIVAVQDAEDSLDPNCAPSYQLRVGEMAPSGQRDGNLAVEMSAMVPELVAGRVLVIPDPEGPDNGYIVRLVNAHMVLDAIRAAENFEATGVAGAATPVAMFGYSGGAFETAAANELQPSYAPELKVVAATAGGVPVANDANIRYIDGTLATGTLMAVAEAINVAYPSMDLFAALNEAGTTFAQTAKTGCASAIFAAPLAHFGDWTTRPNYFAEPAVRAVLEENALGHATPTAPTFYYNAVNDEIVWIEPLDALVADYCAAGAPITYVRDYSGVEHIQGAANFIPMALAFIEARFGGTAVPTTCSLADNAGTRI